MARDRRAGLMMKGMAIMALVGIDAIVFGVADMAAAAHFLDDWGVTQVSATDDRLVYRTRDGAEVIVRPYDAPDLPPPIESGNTVREVIWGAANKEELEKSLASIRTLESFRIGADGLSRATDPNGLSVARFASARQPALADPHPGTSHQYRPRRGIRGGLSGHACLLYREARLRDQ
jgi:hypothetical protein